jgi:hypothetical protein
LETIRRKNASLVGNGPGCFLSEKLFFILLFALCQLSVETSLAREARLLAAEKGIFDLSEIEDSERWSVDLNGEWIFVKDRLLSVEDFRAAGFNSFSTYQAVPSDWQQIYPGSLQYGYGTYILKLVGISETRRNLGVFLNSAFSAYSVYFFSESELNQAYPIEALFHVGQVGKSHAESRPRFLPKIDKLNIQYPEPYYLLIQVSNFDYPRGGLYRPITIGPFEQLQTEQRLDFFWDAMSFGIILIISIYNFLLFLQRPEDKASLWLALFGFVALLNASTNFYFMEYFNPYPSRFVYDLGYKFVYWSWLLFYPVYSHFLLKVFPGLLHAKIIVIQWCFGIPYLIFIALTPVSVYEQHVLPLSIYQFLNFAVFGLILMRAVLRKKSMLPTGFRKLCLACLVLFVCGISDILLTLGWHDGLSLYNFGFIFFFGMQGMVIAERFAKAFRLSEKLSKNLKKEVDRQTRDIRSILHSIHQGVFTIDEYLTISGDYSPYLEVIFDEKSLHGKSALDLMFKSSNLGIDQMSQIKTALEFTIGEPVLAFQANESVFVDEFQIESGSQKMILEVEWAPIVGPKDSIERMLVVLRDVTEFRQLQQQSTQASEELEYIVQLTKVSAEKFNQFYQNTAPMLQENRRLLNQNHDFDPEIIKILFINMHTAKGLARGFGFHKLTNCMHRVEQSFANLLKADDAHTSWDRDKLQSELDEVIEEFERYSSINFNVLGRLLHNEDFAKLSIDKCKLLLKFLHSEFERGQATSEEMNELSQELMPLVYKDVHQILAEALEVCPKIAADLNKPAPDVSIVGDHYFFDRKAADLLHKALAHILRNSLDHGIEQEEQRRILGKSARGKIFLTIEQKSQSIAIFYKDDGRGLNIDSIRQRLARDLREDELAQWSLERLAESIFIDGFSTSQTVSQISGRGVGMSAVRAFLEREGGHIDIILDAEETVSGFIPFHFVLTLPRHLGMSWSGLSQAALPDAS